jgi:hypothetical protein
MENKMSAVETKVIAEFSNNIGSAKLTKLAKSYMVSVEPKYGENEVMSFSNRRRAEIEYAYNVHYFTK